MATGLLKSPTLRSLVPNALPGLALVVGLIGCGDALPRQRTYPVSGQVLLDGQPVPGATVVFHPVDASNFKWQERPQARTDDQGRFTVTTYATNDGAPAGEYKVAIAILTAGEDDGSDQQKRAAKTVRIPPKYRSHETSGLSAAVATRPTNLEPFPLKSKP